MQFRILGHACLEVTSQNRSKYPSTDNEPLAVLLKMKPFSPHPLIHGERLSQPMKSRHRLIQGSMPDMDLVANSKSKGGGLNIVEGISKN